MEAGVSTVDWVSLGVTLGALVVAVIAAVNSCKSRRAAEATAEASRRATKVLEDEYRKKYGTPTFESLAEDAFRQKSDEVKVMGAIERQLRRIAYAVEKTRSSPPPEEPGSTP